MFTLSDRLDKSWSQMSSLLPPGRCFIFLSRKGFAIPTFQLLILVDFRQNLLTRAPVALSASVNFEAGKKPYEYIQVVSYALGGS